MPWRKRGGPRNTSPAFLRKTAPPEEMCGRACDFYTSLFSPDPTDPDACEVLWEELPTVSMGDRDRLELLLTLAEFSEALRRMPTNKSPGMDGLTVEFYRAFWDILGPDLVTVWAESLQSGVLPLSCRRAVLALLPKKGDLRDLRNWCPVSLLSTDYKIVAKAISLRLGSVMADVVHPDQTYTVPGRSIFDNLFLVRDLLELGRRDGLSFALLSLDQEKAFDRVDHGYLLSTLQAFGFGPQFVSFLRVLYASVECLVRLNWTLTEPVSFGRGVRQGCPLSGQLYALAIEPFLCLLRRRMTGLVLREPELWLVLSAYADDVLLVVQDPGDLARVEACQAIYSAASSTRVNWVKSSGLAVGDWRQLDLVIVRRKDLPLVQNTHTFHSADCDTDHALIISKVKITAKKLHRAKPRSKPKINAINTENQRKCQEFVKAFELSMHRKSLPEKAEEFWEDLRTTIHERVLATFGGKSPSGKDWFEENDVGLLPVINIKNTAYLEHNKKQTEIIKVRL
ncbi:unnamed protein product [Caretta caretta]